MFNKVSKSFRFGNHDVTLTTGELDLKANGERILNIEEN